MSLSETVTELRKAGKLKEALLLAQSQLAEKPDDLYRKRDLAWVHYAFIKHHPEDVRSALEHTRALCSLDLDWEGESMLTGRLAWALVKAGNAWLRRNREHYAPAVQDLLGNVLLLHLEPAEAYCPRAALLQLALKVAGDWDLFEAFVTWWNPELLKPEDYHPWKPPQGGKTVPALAERLHITLAKRLLQPPLQEDLIRDFIPRLHALARAQPGYQYVRWYAGKLQLALRDYAAAREDLLPFLARNRRAFWAWQLLGETFREEDPQLAIACFCKAVTVGQDEAFLVRLREELAALLYSTGNSQAAKAEIEVLARTRLDRNWRLPPRVVDWVQLPNFPGTEAIPLDYAREAAPAEELLPQPSRPRTEKTVTSVAVLSSLQSDGKRGFWVDEEGRHGLIPGHLLPQGIAPGDGLLLQLYETPKGWHIKTCKIRQGDVPSSLRKEVSGTIRTRPGQTFGFVGDIYLGKDLLPGSPGGRWKVTAVRSFHPGKKALVWTAIDIQKARP